MRSARTGAAVLFQTGDRGKRTFRQPQHIQDIDLLRQTTKSVSAALAAQPLENARTNQQLHDAFKIFLRDLLPLGDLAQRHIFLLPPLGKIDEDPHGIAPACGNHHKTASFFFQAIIP